VGLKRRSYSWLASSGLPSNRLFTLGAEVAALIGLLPFHSASLMLAAQVNGPLMVVVPLELLVLATTVTVRTNDRDG
jgi:hypothetical protein